MHKKEYTPRKGPGLSQELKELDARFVEMLTERTRLLSKITAARRSKGRSLIDSRLEKELWSGWEEAGRHYGLPAKLLKQMFIASNSLAYSCSDERRRSHTEFPLRMHQGEAALSLPGLPDTFEAMLYAALAAVSGTETELTPILLNDPLVELCKALNKAGARFEWEGERLTLKKRPKESEENVEETGLELDGATLFAGNDLRVLFLIIGLSLSNPGRVRLSGGPELKLLDASSINRVLVQFGARLGQVRPNSPGLPARLECGGEAQAEITIPADAPEYLASCLAAFGWTLPGGVTLIFSKGSKAAHGMETVHRVLTACGIEAKLRGASITVSEATPRIPGEIRPHMDPVLSASLLALPLFRDGQATLKGYWPATTEAEGVVELLKSSGLELEFDKEQVVAKRGSDKPTTEFTPSSPQLLALCMALATRLPKASIAIPEELSVMEAESLARAVGLTGETDGNILLAERAKELPEEGYLAPSPWHALALALASGGRMGLSLANPDVMVQLWPGFLNIFKQLPEIQSETLLKKEEKDVEEKPKRRRVRVN